MEGGGRARRVDGKLRLKVEGHSSRAGKEVAGMSVP